ncbi:MAG: DinB family protein [Calditrichaeota bacterium]|nr:DinB family protein [Candidatus Cloacimonadota bacterium]MCB1045864.1 DinB family protein [Calditrichota bacterium]MCB9473732.1 DinB family protein [Candidatus Delongbacteria bacterium]
MSIASCRNTLDTLGKFFNRSLEAFDESDSGFAPFPGMFSVAQQVAHSAQTIDWFLVGAFDPKGMKEDWEDQELKVRAVTSLAKAKAWHDEAIQRVQEKLSNTSEADWMAPIAEKSIMGGAPRASIFEAILDHAAHHRGSLAVYARCAGKTPVMPYM